MTDHDTIRAELRSAELELMLQRERVADFLGVGPELISLYPMPNLNAVNLLIRDILDNPLRLDSQGKTLGQVLLQMPLVTTEAEGS